MKVISIIIERGCWIGLGFSTINVNIYSQVTSFNVLFLHGYGEIRCPSIFSYQVQFVLFQCAYFALAFIIIIIITIIMISSIDF